MLRKKKTDSPELYSFHLPSCKNVKPHLFNFCLILRLTYALGWGYTSDLIKILRRQKTQAISRWSISAPLLLPLASMSPTEQFTTIGTIQRRCKALYLRVCLNNNMQVLFDNRYFYQQWLKTHLFKNSLFLASTTIGIHIGPSNFFL